MIDTDKYEGCQTNRPLVLHKGLLCPTVFMDVGGSGEIVPTLDRGIVDVQADISEHYLQLLQDAPLLLAEVLRLREVINKAMQQHTVLEMRGQLFESGCIDAEGQVESGHWEESE